MNSKLVFYSFYLSIFYFYLNDAYSAVKTQFKHKNQETGYKQKLQIINLKYNDTVQDWSAIIY